MTSPAHPSDGPADATAVTAADTIAWRQFQRYWYGHIASFAGDWFTVLALPLAALAINGSPLFVGVVEFAELVATLAVGMRLGALADRLPPRAVMIAADVARAALVGLLAVLFIAGAPHEVLLVIVAFVLGSMRDLHDGGESVMMAAVVPESLLVRANSRFQISDGLGHMLGSLLAGVAATISLSLAFGVDAVSYLFAAVAVWAMGTFTVARSPEELSHPDDVADDGELHPTPTVRRRIAPWRAAWRVARAEGRYWRVLVTMCVTNVATVCFMGQFVTFGTKELGLANWQIGLTLSVMGFGSFAAGIALDRIGAISPRTILVAPVIIGLAPIVSGVTRSWAVTMVSFCLVGAVLSLGGALVGSMRHASFDPSVQGRIALGSRLGFSSGVLPGVLVGGWLSQAVGAAEMYVVFGCIGLCGFVVGLVLGVERLTTLTGGASGSRRGDRPGPDIDLTGAGIDLRGPDVDLTDPARTVDDGVIDLRVQPVPVPPEMSDEAVRALLAEALRSIGRTDTGDGPYGPRQ